MEASGAWKAWWVLVCDVPGSCDPGSIRSWTTCAVHLPASDDARSSAGAIYKLCGDQKQPPCLRLRSGRFTRWRRGERHGSFSPHRPLEYDRDSFLRIIHRGMPSTSPPVGRRPLLHCGRPQPCGLQGPKGVGVSSGCSSRADRGWVLVRSRSIRYACSKVTMIQVQEVRHGSPIRGMY